MLIKSKKLIEYNQSLTDTLILFLLAQFILLTKVYMMVKAITLAAIMFLWFSKQKGRFLVNKTAIVLFIYVIYNVFSTALGVFNGYSAAALRSSTINVIWPAVFLFFINCYFSVERLRKIFKALVWLTLIICVLDSLIIISYIFHVSGIVSVLNKLHLGGSAGTSTLIFFRSDHMYLYAFLSPFMFVTLLLNKNILNQTGMKLRFIKSVAIYASLMAVLSGMG